MLLKREKIGFRRTSHFVKFRKGDESSGLLHLFSYPPGLACFDALFLLTAIVAFGLPKLSDWYEKKVFLPIMAVTFGLLHTFRVGSVYVTLSVNFERFYAIVFPLKHFGWKKYLLPGELNRVYSIKG